MRSEKGEGLLELVISLAIAVLVLGALAFAIITSLRNAQFAKKQAQATKLAQEALEKIRSLRDRDQDGTVNYTRADSTHTSKFSDLWGVSCTENPDSVCYFVFNSSGVLTGGTNTDVENIPVDLPIFKRQIQIEDVSNSTMQKQITAIVQWTDTSGVHKSQLTTVLGKTL